MTSASSLSIPKPHTFSSAYHLRAGLLQLQALPPLALYVHMPWCIQKCPYCDFNSHTISGNVHQGYRNFSIKEPQKSSTFNLKWQEYTNSNENNSKKIIFIDSMNTFISNDLQKQYIDALIADLEATLPLIWGRPVESVFIGGGTPSLFDPQWIDTFLSAVRARVPLSADCEITLEANPGTFETHRFQAYRQAGITRLSIGVQSFHDTNLQALGRVHNGQQALAAIEEAARYFDTFNVDLMYALPNQSVDALEQELRHVQNLNIPHVSIYHLTLEPNTYFAKYPPPLPDEDTAYEMLDLITHALQTQSMARYEVSAYAKEGHQCWHNRNYWQFGDYLGIGAGAHSKISFPSRIVRQIRHTHPHSYMQQAFAGNSVSNAHEIKRKDLAFEFMLGALRLISGFDLDTFVARTGLPPSAVEDTLKIAQKENFIAFDGKKVKPTAHGFDFLSDLQSLFLN